MKRKLLVPIRQSISTILLKYVFAIYFLIALGVTIIHMAAEYIHVRENIFREIQILNSSVKSLVHFYTRHKSRRGTQSRRSTTNSPAFLGLLTLARPFFIFLSPRMDRGLLSIIRLGLNSIEASSLCTECRAPLEIIASVGIVLLRRRGEVQQRCRDPSIPSNGGSFVSSS